MAATPRNRVRDLLAIDNLSHLELRELLDLARGAHGRSHTRSQRCTHHVFTL
jgi:hypothetical protein